MATTQSPVVQTVTPHRHPTPFLPLSIALHYQISGADFGVSKNFRYRLDLRSNLSFLSDGQAPRPPRRQAVGMTGMLDMGTSVNGAECISQSITPNCLTLNSQCWVDILLKVIQDFHDGMEARVSRGRQKLKSTTFAPFQRMFNKI